MAGRLYKTAPQVAATPAQGQDALDVYLGAVPKPVEQLVDVANVPLVHPLGRPHDTSTGRPDAHALNLHYARVGVAPDSAHNGDPLPMAQQPKLQQATRGPDGKEIPLGIPGIYRGYDDGYFYAANEGTQESAEVQALRRKRATEKADTQGDAAAIAANDNDPEIDEAVARSYGEQAPIKSSVKSVAAESNLSQQRVGAEGRLPQLISAIEKFQNSESLSADYSDLLKRTEAAFAKAGVSIDLKKVDVERLKQTVERAASSSNAVDDLNAGTIKSTSPAIAGATLAIPAGGASLTGLRTAAAAVGTLLEEAAVGTAALGVAAFTGLVGGFLALMMSSTQGPEADESPSLYQKSATQSKPADIDREKAETIQEMPNMETAARPSNPMEQISSSLPLAAPKAPSPNSEATQASASDSSLKHLIVENYQTYSSLIAKLRKGESLTKEEASFSREIISKFGASEASVGKNLETTEPTPAGTPSVLGETTPASLEIAPAIKQWLFNLLRGNSNEDAQPDRDEAYEFCRNLCTDIYENNPHQLPGEGSDMSARWRRCVRDCLKDHGYSDF
ncbi:hypothetical protein [Dongia sp.]|uniref:hypothetical protein n=1 Tax=Dongia sp. TaxID=1977262 RepID=UPI0035B0CAF1